MKQFSEILNPYDSICINISVFDYFIVFNQIPSDTIVYDYRCELNSNELKLQSITIYNDIHIFLNISGPFASQTISTKKGGLVSFSYGSLPNICKTGILFTNNQYIDSIYLSNAQTMEGYHIDTDDDLCIVSTIKANQSYSLSMQTEKCCDKLFVYRSMSPVIAYSGPVDETFILDSDDEPVVFRFVSDNTTEESKYVKIVMGSEGGDFPYEAGIRFYSPPNNSKVCPDYCPLSKYIILIEVSIVLGIIIGTILIFLAIYCISSRCRRRRSSSDLSDKDRPNSNSNSILLSKYSSVENRNEPNGYFALDPILRPKI